ncbi:MULTISPECIES: metal-dependent hydrolase [Paraburkholderia]|uniref:metal-dependent hydrolase n=1 Tax=Paraburkholderia TaxID=1822464 RepID=UPI0022517DA0|nr:MULTISPECIES: metal-dependent hydrolase [Paraburkholderia]MCX4166291.1 metal-dependent hydrolase [Paraburkholderia megapolitana]MDN7161781.1 metal-dependent hydrolase [Paraburkholderia sp. CHISQ3]MDQ6498829.1 metal-dependent hydrolase [Paraburkholderia megapolitana]
MTSSRKCAIAIVARENIDFGFDESIPRHWFDNDPYKSRFLDGLQISFPEGERFFISSVRAVRHRIKDRQLIQQVKDFTRQEGQHGMAHIRYNEILVKQGMPVEKLSSIHKHLIDEMKARVSEDYSVAITAAVEHFTASLADSFFARKVVTKGMEPRMRALWAWHAIEEMEHKSVVFDVMTSVTRISYRSRIGAMLLVIWQLNRITGYFTDQMLKADGFNWIERRMLKLKNLGWLYGFNGVKSRMIPGIVRYMLPGFHPSKIANLHNYPSWVAEYERSADPHLASAALLAAAS